MIDSDFGEWGLLVGSVAGDCDPEVGGFTGNIAAPRSAAPLVIERQCPPRRDANIPRRPGSRTSAPPLGGTGRVSAEQSRTGEWRSGGEDGELDRGDWERRERGEERSEGSGLAIRCVRGCLRSGSRGSALRLWPGSSDSARGRRGLRGRRRRGSLRTCA